LQPRVARGMLTTDSKTTVRVDVADGNKVAAGSVECAGDDTPAVQAQRRVGKTTALLPPAVTTLIPRVKQLSIRVVSYIAPEPEA